MDYHALSIHEIAKRLQTNVGSGLTQKSAVQSQEKHGLNKLSEKKGKNVFQKIASALREPMLIILLFSFIVSIGANVGQFFKTGEGDFKECFGILFAVVLSVGITLIMEGSSERAFRALGKIYQNVYVKVLRDNTVVVISQENVCVGDIVLLSAGDKIVADGRLIECSEFSVDESALTGESKTSKKRADLILNANTPLAERENMVYSACFVASGDGKMIVTAVGDNTEIGKIAKDVKDEKEIQSPLSEKLASLGKKITIIGIIASTLVFVLSLIRLIVGGAVTFNNVQNHLISSIILIVAAVPEGLPTIVAVSLALNMIKLSKENALIKKMIATETTGAVSVICSDKTGTLTLNKMSVEKICTSKYCFTAENLNEDALLKNFVLNTTADVVKKKNEYIYQGSGTECALIVAFMKANRSKDYSSIRREYQIVDRKPFSSQSKMMSTTVMTDNGLVEYIKGAPEKILPLTNIDDLQKRTILSDMQKHQRKAKRILCFAHRLNEGPIVYDGYTVLTDKIRPDVKKAVSDCKKAGIKVKILTGDNRVTAFAVAEEIGVADSPYQVVNASELENLSDDALKKILYKITVVARSTPSVKLRVVKALKEMGEVVAVTGDGINDAPAIRHADVGFAMGKTGSEITKETADVVLLDDSFSTIVRAVSFGRNVYKNLQRFILFQLSVNISALLFITVCALLGVPTPFNTLQLLWINIIMDGPPALTLGLEKDKGDLMDAKPIKRSSQIVTKNMFLRIALSGGYVAVIMLLQYFTNFLRVSDWEKSGVIFTLFIMFQLSNAFNSRELGKKSIFASIGKNKIMLLTFTITFILQIIIVTFCPAVFGISRISITSWLKTLLVSSSIIVISELYKWVYRKTRRIDKIDKRVA